jgi:hypothetical protein
MQEMWIVLLLGLAAGAASSAFIHLMQRISSYSESLAFWQRATLAGLAVGLGGLIAPEVLGIGYDTVNDLLLGETTQTLLLLLLVVKLISTSFCLGMGIPGGTIGPTLFIGAVIGGLFAPLPGMLFDGPVSEPGFYALIGMGAVMGASLQAPLAALTAVIELSHNPKVVLPGMLAIVMASLISSELFRKQSLFISILRAKGMDYDTSPVMQSLRRKGVASIMNRNYFQCSRLLSPDMAEQILERSPEWILVDDQQQKAAALLPGVDLARHLEQNPEGEVDLLDIPAKRYQLSSISLLANLQEALEQLEKTGAEALYVERLERNHSRTIQGILTRKQIESAYHY